MNYSVLLLLIGGYFCGCKVITIEGSGRRGPTIPVLPEISGFPDAAPGPVDGNNEYYRYRFASLPAVPSHSMASSDMFSEPAISGNGYYYGRNIGISEPEDGNFVGPLIHSLRRQNFHHDVRFDEGDGGRDTRRSVVSGYPPRRHRSIFRSRYYPRSRIYFYPPQYAGYHYGFGNLDFFVSGKNNDEAKDGTIVRSTARSSGDGQWKHVSRSVTLKDGTKSSTSQETVLKSGLSPIPSSVFKAWEDEGSNAMPWKDAMLSAGLLEMELRKQGIK